MVRYDMDVCFYDSARTVGRNLRGGVAMGVGCLVRLSDAGTTTSNVLCWCRIQAYISGMAQTRSSTHFAFALVGRDNAFSAPFRQQTAQLPRGMNMSSMTGVIPFS